MLNKFNNTPIIASSPGVRYPPIGHISYNPLGRLTVLTVLLNSYYVISDSALTHLVPVDAVPSNFP